MKSIDKSESLEDFQNIIEAHRDALKEHYKGSDVFVDFIVMATLKWAWKTRINKELMAGTTNTTTNTKSYIDVFEELVRE